MTKQEAINLFGTITELSKALGISTQAVSQWPDELTNRIKYRVIGVAYQKGKLNKQGEIK